MTVYLPVLADFVHVDDVVRLADGDFRRVRGESDRFDQVTLLTILLSWFYKSFR